MAIHSGTVVFLTLLDSFVGNGSLVFPDSFRTIGSLASLDSLPINGSLLV